MFIVVKKFNIKIADGAKLTLDLSTNTGASIPINDFVGIVKPFHKSNFVLNVKYVSTEISRNEKMVTPMLFFLLIYRILLSHV